MTAHWGKTFANIWLGCNFVYRTVSVSLPRQRLKFLSGAKRKQIFSSFLPKREIFNPYNFYTQKISRSVRNDMFGSFCSDTKYKLCPQLPGGTNKPCLSVRSIPNLSVYSNNIDKQVCLYHTEIRLNNQ